MTQVIIPGFGRTRDLGGEGVSRLYHLVAALDRPPIDLAQPDPYDDIDSVVLASIPAGYDGGGYDLANDPSARQFYELTATSHAAEAVRAAEDAEPLAANAEDRLAGLLGRIAAGTYTPRGQAAWGLANEADPYAATTGGWPCGFIDATGRCGERFHATTCNSLATPEIGETLRGQMEDIAARPHLDSGGRVWRDRQFGAGMTLADHLEQASGVRMGDTGLFETGRSRRELVSAERTPVYGDPDDPDSFPLPFPAATGRTAARLAAQAGIATTADHARQREAGRAEHDRQAARYRGPVHPDYADFSNAAPAPAGLAQVGETWNGSLPQYALGAR